MKDHYLPNFKRYIVAALTAMIISLSLEAQVATSYAFSQTLGTYQPIFGGHTLAATVNNTTGASMDDDAYFFEPIGFQFYYNGGSFSHFWVNTNGFIKLGDITTPPSSTYYFGPPLSLNPNCISAFCNDLMGQGSTRSTSELRVETMGTEPYRTCVIQFKDWSAYPGDATTAGEIYNFQIRLYENDGNGYSEIVYGAFATTLYTTPTARPVQAGISGSVITDVNLRTGTGSWDSTAAGFVNTGTVAFYNTKMPINGLTYTWTIPPAPMVIDSVTTIQYTDGAVAGTINNPVVAAVVYTHGSNNRKIISQLSFNTTGTTSLSHISNAKVHFTGTGSDFNLATMVHQFGATVASPSGTMNFTDLDTLLPGANYFWLTYNISGAATVGSFIDGQCTNVQDSGFNNRTPSITSPAGSRKVIVPLSGIYTIDPAGSGQTNYTSFDLALSSLAENGVSGNVRFIVAPGTYNVASPINIEPFIDRGNGNQTVTFEGTSAATTIITGSLSTSPIIRLNRTKNITIKNLTITNSFVGSCAGIAIIGSTTLRSAGSNTTIKGCTINLPGAGTTTATAAISMTDDQSGTTLANSMLMDSVLIDSNNINGGYYGIGIRGALNLLYNRGITITNNNINVYYYGTWLYYVHAALNVQRNIVRNSVFGIYFFRSDGNGNAPHLIIGNKVTNFTNTGIYYRNDLPNMGYIYNNLVSSASAGALRCLYMEFAAAAANAVGEVYHNTLVFNTAATTAGYGPMYVTGSSSVAVRNNILLFNATTGSQYSLYLNTPPTGNIVNGNLYFNRANTNLVYRGGITYTPATYLSTIGGGDSSFNVSPEFVDNMDYKLSHGCNPRSALNLNASIPLDFEGHTRGTSPYIGYDETAQVTNDIAVDSLLFPKAPITGGATDLVVRVRNMGSNIVTSFSISYVHNGGLPVTQVASVTLNPCDTASIVFTGLQQISMVGTNYIALFTSQPNANTDNNKLNDTARYNLFGPLSGIYTVGGTTPDFSNLNAAVTALTQSGISGPVTFNVRPGTYNEQVRINGAAVTGLSSANRITFDGGNAATTSIVFNVTQQAVVILNQCNYVAFRNFTVQNTNTANPVGVGIVGNATVLNNGTGCAIKNCNVILNPSAPGNTTYGINVTSSANGYGATATWSDSVEIDSNTISGAYYNIYFYGRSSATGNLEVKLRNNTITNSGYYGIYVTSLYAPFDVLNNVVNNVITPANTYGYMGIYLTSCTNGSTTVPSRVIGNRVFNASNYGIYLSTIGGTATNPWKIYNNMTSSASFTAYNGLIISSTGGAAEIYNNTFVHNAINTTTTTTYGACYITGSVATNTKIKNNIFVVTATSGNTTPLYLGTNPATSAVNYNTYYNSSNANLLYRNATFFTGLNYKTAAAGGDSSYQSQVSFVNLYNDLHLTSACSYRGVNLAGLADYDIDNNLRATLPQIGCDEFVGSTLDLYPEMITQPSLPVSAGLQNVVVKVRNNGSLPVTSFTTGYRLNNGAAVTQTWNTGTLNPCDSVMITFTGGQQMNLPAGGSNILKVYTYAPNGGTDAVVANDTISMMLGTPMAGAYTIGATASDYTTINAAVTDMRNRSIAGAVVFNIRTGVYNEQVLLNNDINGVSATNRITFQSMAGQRDSVVISYGATSLVNNFVLKLIGANYITLKDITLSALNVPYSRALEFVGATSFDSVVNCRFTALTNNSTSLPDAAVVYTLNNTGSNTVFTGNAIVNGGSGFYWYGVSTSARYNGLVFDNNTITNAYYMSCYTYYTSAVKIRNNTISTNSIYGTHYGLAAGYSNNGLEVLNNKVLNQYGGYGLYIYLCDGTTGIRSKVFNNEVTYNPSSTGTSYGLYGYQCTYTDFFNNSIRTATTSATNYTGYCYQSTTAHATSVFRNNIFANTGTTGYALYIYNPLYSTSNGNNLLFSASPNYIYKGLATATAYATLDLFRVAFPGQETNSLVYRPAFISNSNLSINTSDSASWVINGRGMQLATNATDFNGNPRSISVAGGAPDIGAYEFTPAVQPLYALVTGTPVAGGTQAIMVGGDTLATIVWDPTSAVPSAITARYYSGTFPPGTQPADYRMNAYWDIQDVGGFGGYNYTANLYYKDEMRGSVSTEANLRLAKRHDPNPWTLYTGTLSTVDVTRNILTTPLLTDFSWFTGTDDVNPLPVKLTSFQATAVGKDVFVNWITASEENAAYFVVEVSADGKHFAPVGKVTARGHSTSSSSYEFVHTNAQKDMNGVPVIYYRLVSVDHDKYTEESAIIMVRFINKVGKERGAIVYPNPFSNHISATFDAVNDGNVTVKLTDIQGRVMKTVSQRVINGSNTIRLDDTQGLMPGVYFISIIGAGEQVVIKTIKMN